MRVMAYPVPTLWNPSPALLGVFLLFFVAATAEELGYSAYAADALQSRMTALHTAIVIAPFWALWHLPSMTAMGQSTELIGLTPFPRTHLGFLGSMALVA